MNRISLIVPSRRRLAQLDHFLASVAATAERRDLLEIVLVADADDPDTLAVSDHGLAVQPVVVAPGQTMGTLNRAGESAATGDILMLLNDDVTARTPGWDEAVRRCFAAFADGIVLVHVNDTVFEKALCTFPIVSRRFCTRTGGICPADYRRYRIDDHVEELFNLLGALGERRSLYLPDVVFEHANHVTNEHGKRQYFSDPEVLEIDADTFDRCFDERRRLALRLMETIHPRASEEQVARWWSQLALLPDGFGLRRPERLRVVPADELAAGVSPREPWLNDLRQRARRCFRERGCTGVAAALGRRLLRLSAVR